MKATIKTTNGLIYEGKLVSSDKYAIRVEMEELSALAMMCLDAIGADVRRWTNDWSVLVEREFIVNVIYED